MTGPARATFVLDQRAAGAAATAQANDLAARAAGFDPAAVASLAASRSLYAMLLLQLADETLTRCVHVVDGSWLDVVRWVPSVGLVCEPCAVEGTDGADHETRCDIGHASEAACLVALRLGMPPLVIDARVCTACLAHDETHGPAMATIERGTRRYGADLRRLLEPVDDWKPQR